MKPRYTELTTGPLYFVGHFEKISSPRESLSLFPASGFPLQRLLIQWYSALFSVDESPFHVEFFVINEKRYAVNFFNNFAL